MKREYKKLLPILLIFSAVHSQDFDDTNFGKIPMEMLKMYEQHYRVKSPENYARKMEDRRLYESALAADTVFQQIAEYCRINRFRRSMYTKKYVGNSEGILSAMIRTKDGGAMLVGSLPNPEKPGTSLPHLIRFDKSLNIVWDKSYSKKEFVTYEGSGVYEEESGSFILHLLAYRSPGGYQTSWILKINGEGNVLWEQFMHKKSISIPYSNRVMVQSDGSIRLEGTVQDKSEIVFPWSGEINSSGEITNRTIGDAL